MRRSCVRQNISTVLTGRLEALIKLDIGLASFPFSNLFARFITDAPRCAAGVLIFTVILCLSEYK